MFITAHGINWILCCLQRSPVDEGYIHSASFMVPYSMVNCIALVESYCSALQWLLSVFNSAELKGIIYTRTPVTKPCGPFHLYTQRIYLQVSTPSFPNLYLDTFRDALLFSIFSAPLYIIILKLNAVI